MKGLVLRFFSSNFQKKAVEYPDFKK